MKLSLGKAILAVATTMVVVSIIAGVLVVGSPNEGRREQLDAERIADLTGIVTAIDSFWIRNERLPASLAELADDPRVHVNTVDPDLGESYHYELLPEDTYRLCAEFDRESPAPAGRTAVDFWSHGVGRRCFDVAVNTRG